MGSNFNFIARSYPRAFIFFFLIEEKHFRDFKAFTEFE